jgi:hypothetical protein
MTASVTVSSAWHDFVQCFVFRFLLRIVSPVMMRLFASCRFVVLDVLSPLGKQKKKAVVAFHTLRPLQQR